MSAPHGHSGHGHAAHDDGSHGSHGSYASYATGFVLAVVLTAIPFYAVMNGMVAGGRAVALVMGTALVQILVHLHFFLHIDRKTDKWTWQALIFTGFVLAIVIGGSVWVMYHLNTNMMPDMSMEMQGEMARTAD